MHKGLTAAVAHSENPVKKEWPDSGDDETLDCIINSNLDYALIAVNGLMPQTLNEVLKGPNKAHWQKALEYEIGQLEKLKTWVIEDLPKCRTAIFKSSYYCHKIVLKSTSMDCSKIHSDS